jgi:myo-inositol 2-dehydrogenase/D-chiro-inositol 1-dehydrogenase
MPKTLGVGIIGAGPVTQAIHLPVLSGMLDRLRVVRVMDVDSNLAAKVAERAAAQAATTVEEVVDDPDVDIVAVCSPHAFHAEQVAAACAAGKRAILCEKPLATSADDAATIAGAAKSSGVPIIVGTMHAYDPAYLAVREEWGDLSRTATLVRSRIYLPANDVMVRVATDPLDAPPLDLVSKRMPTTLPHPPTLRDGILGLAMHAIPLIRDFVPDPGTVTFATSLQPWGYSIAVSSPGRAVQMIGLMPGQWAPDWTLDVYGPDQELRICFPPSYVMAGSATAELISQGTSRLWHYQLNGYQREWAHVADVAKGLVAPAPGVAVALADLQFALEIADSATAAERAEAEDPRA